eukprot:8656767-Pyramimonas_sp.AAC.1
MVLSSLACVIAAMSSSSTCQSQVPRRNSLTGSSESSSLLSSSDVCHIYARAYSVAAMAVMYTHVPT